MEILTPIAIMAFQQMLVTQVRISCYSSFILVLQEKQPTVNGSIPILFLLLCKKHAQYTVMLP